MSKLLFALLALSLFGCAAEAATEADAIEEATEANPTTTQVQRRRATFSNALVTEVKFDDFDANSSASTSTSTTTTTTTK